MRKLLIPFLAILFLLGCAKKPVKIGVIVPLSGGLSSYGNICLKGIKLAVKHINAEGGLRGRPVELLVEDNKGESNATEIAIEKLNNENVVVIIGPLTTKNTMQIGKYADDKGIPIITPTATGIGATKNRDWVWRISFTDPFQGAVLAKFAIEDLKVNSVCVFVNPRDPYSSVLSESFQNEFKKLGGKILAEVTFANGDSVFDSQLKLIRETHPRCVFVPAFYQEAGLITRQARVMGFRIPFLGGDGWDSPEFQKIIGNRAGVNYYSTHFFYNYGATEVQDFLHNFRLEYGSEPETFSALGYDAMRLVEKVFESARRVTRKEFQYNIKRTQFLGATGTINFTQARDPRRSLMLLKFEPGKPIEVVGAF